MLPTFGIPETDKIYCGTPAVYFKFMTYKMLGEYKLNKLAMSFKAGLHDL